MSDSSHIYIAIDLKSFLCISRMCRTECDPLTTNLVVADETEQRKQSVLQYHRH